MADTTSSNFARKLKDKKISEMQIVDTHKSVQELKIKKGVSMSGDKRSRSIKRGSSVENSVGDASEDSTTYKPHQHVSNILSSKRGLLNDLDN